MMRGRSIKCGSSGSQAHGISKLQSKMHGKRGNVKKYYWHRKNGGKNFEAST